MNAIELFHAAEGSADENRETNEGEAPSDPSSETAKPTTMKNTKTVQSGSLERVGRPLWETAAAIDAHLKRMEGDPSINTEMSKGIHRYYCAGASVGGRWVYVKYISYQHTSNLSRQDAEWYLKWLDGGGQGRHYEALRERPTDQTQRTDTAGGAPCNAVAVRCSAWLGVSGA